MWGRSSPQKLRPPRRPFLFHRLPVGQLANVATAGPFLTCYGFRNSSGSLAMLLASFAWSPWRGEPGAAISDAWSALDAQSPASKPDHEVSGRASTGAL